MQSYASYSASHIVFIPEAYLKPFQISYDGAFFVKMWCVARFGTICTI